MSKLRADSVTGKWQVHVALLSVCPQIPLCPERPAQPLFHWRWDLSGVIAVAAGAQLLQLPVKELLSRQAGSLSSR